MSSACLAALVAWAVSQSCVARIRPSSREVDGRELSDRMLPAILGVEGGFQSSATGGHVFAMEKSRTFEGPRLDLVNAPTPFPEAKGKSCERWAVLTSIFEPTETVKQLGEMEDWCVVVVGDRNGPITYDVPGVVYLTAEDQERLPYEIIDLLPWNHFGRKNVGYLFAVHHGAKIIYDVDDDNALIWPDEGVPHADPTPERRPLYFHGSHEATVHNPYGCFGGPGNVWPRGFPLNAINKESSALCHLASAGDDHPSLPEESWTLGVVQALANHDPDVDAIYRMTYPAGGLPFDFDEPPSDDGSSPLRIVPKSAMTPFNAQATLHFEPAFWGLLLPVTVHGRVSDIWRSFFTQTLLPSVDAVVAFAPAWVAQVRNPHDYLADFQAELPLYQRSGALVEFLIDIREELSRQEDTGVPIFERVEALAVSMFEHGILGEEDVKLSQAWIRDLYAVGYVPPPVAQ